MTQQISLFFQVQGYYVGAKATIEALTGTPEGSIAYATDTDEFGSFNGMTWAWANGSSVASEIFGAGSENITDGDFFGFVDIGDGNTLKKIAISNFRTQYLNSYYLRLDQLSNWPHQGSDPSAPAAGFTKVYTKSDGLYLRDNSAIVGPLIAQALADTLYAPIAKGVTNGDSHDHNGGDGAQIDYNNLSNLPTLPTDETIQDLIGAMVSGNVETGIAVTYDDTNGKLDFDAQTAGDARYAPIAKGVTNGDSHDHSGGDGAQIAYSSLSGLPTLPTDGTYTPTGTTGTNVDTVTPGNFNYSRIGNHVTFDGVVQIDATATGAFTCYLSLPIASDFTTTGDANGNGTNPGTGTPNIISIREDVTNNRLQLDGYAQVATNLFYRVVGGYLVR